MAMPQCCYLAKRAKRPSHSTNTIKFDRIPFDPCNSIKRFDLCPFDQKISTYLQPPLNDSIFSPEAKYNHIIDAKKMKSSMKSIQNSEIQSALRPTPEPVKKHVYEKSLSREIIINGLVEDKGTFKSSFEADNSKLQEVFNHMDKKLSK